MKKTDLLLGDSCIFSLGCTHWSLWAWIRQRIATDNELPLIMGDSTLRFFLHHICRQEGGGAGGVLGGGMGCLITVLQQTQLPLHRNWCRVLTNPDRKWQQRLSMFWTREVRGNKTEDIYDWKINDFFFFISDCRQWFSFELSFRNMDNYTDKVQYTAYRWQHIPYTLLMF